MGFVDHILIKLETSFIQGFLRLPLWCPLGSNLCKHAGGWSVHLTYSGLCGMELTGAICAMITRGDGFLNSLAPGRWGSDFKNIIFKLNIQSSSLETHREIVLRWTPQNLTNEKSTLVQATSHYLNKCLKSVTRSGVTMLQCVNCLRRGWFLTTNTLVMLRKYVKYKYLLMFLNSARG